MATFAKTAFNSVAYAAGRPTYPNQLFDFIFKYHEKLPRARWDLAVDLGCGTGQATSKLTPFKKIVGIDPGKGMLQKAQEHVDSLNLSSGQTFEFRQGSSEDLSFLPEKSVDLVIAAQACHWFDWSKVWPELARVLRPQGTVAFWNYSEMRLTNYPAATPAIERFWQGTDERSSIGPHFERPGRTILERHLVDVPSPESIIPGAFSDFQRVYFTGSHHPDLPSPLPVILRTKMTWTNLMTYLRSASAYHTYQEKFPEDKSNPQGDIATRFYNEMKGIVNDVDRTPERVVKDEDTIAVEWPVALLLAKRA